MNDQPLYDAVAAGLMRTEDQMAKLGISHWKVAMVAYDPDNPKAYMVLGSAGEEEVQKKLGLVINPEDVSRQHDYVAPRVASPVTSEMMAKAGWGDPPAPVPPTD